MCRFEQHVSQSPLTFNFFFSLTVQVCILQIIFLNCSDVVCLMMAPVTIIIVTNVLGFNLEI